MIIPVDDPADPRISAYRDVRERDLVGREGKFIAEGETVLSVLLGSALHKPESLLIAEKRIEGLMPLIGALDVPVYAAGPAVIDTVVGFPLHRGILAVGMRAPEPEPAALLAGAKLVVALFGIANHDNMGGIFRNAAAFGADAVLLDATCCDPLYRKAIRVSVGGALKVPFARLGKGEDAIALLARSGLSSFAFTPAGALRLDEMKPPPRAALLFGTEGPGLPDSILGQTRTVRLEMGRSFDSLNVATTSGIALHHFTTRRA